MAMITSLPTVHWERTNTTRETNRRAFAPTQRRIHAFHVTDDNPATRIQDGPGIGVIGVLPFTLERQSREKSMLVKFSSTDHRGSSENPESEITAATEKIADGSSPPYLTIIAGLLVFLLFVWAIWSLLIWIESFFVR